MTPGARWLDVACGTGYFLSHFPDAERMGLDLSPDMLERARDANPGVEFRQHDYREPIPDWVDRFDLVSCMWYAYCYVDTLAELSELIRNLSSWTAPSGHCFVPLADPNLIAMCDLPHRRDAPEWWGDVTITGILWSYTDGPANKVHRHLLSPKTEFMTDQFAQFFERVDVIEYPPVTPGVGRRPALLASAKRQQPRE